MNTKLTLNGRDGIGKTQQMRLLRGQPELHLTQALKQYGDWPKLTGNQEFDWWFGENDFDGFLRTITCALNARNRDDAAGKVTVHERGTLMFLAVCMATLATRKQCEVAQIRTMVRRQFTSLLDYSSDAETNILFAEDHAYQGSIKEFESRVQTPGSPYTDQQNKIYQQYQENLRIALDLCLRPDAPRILVNRPAVDTQNQLRSVISNVTGLELDNLCEHLVILFCLGGMSESGKSLLGQNLHTCHGSYRLKLKYFSEGIFGDDFALAEEILRFLNAHRHITLASVESMHNPGLPVAFKKLLGDRARIVYLDASRDERGRRHMLSPKATMEEFLRKDALKESRGAHKVKPIADLVIDTGADTPETTCQQVFGHK